MPGKDESAVHATGPFIGRGDLYTGATCRASLWRGYRTYSLFIGPVSLSQLQDTNHFSSCCSLLTQAGVLRGEKARFQLFGDTVNTAARMESTGQVGRIQASAETAELLIASGKQSWVRPREEKVEAKGKGLLSTYWVEPLLDKTHAESPIEISPEDTESRESALVRELSLQSIMLQERDGRHMPRSSEFDGSNSLGVSVLGMSTHSVENIEMMDVFHASA